MSWVTPYIENRAEWNLTHISGPFLGPPSLSLSLFFRSPSFSFIIRVCIAVPYALTGKVRPPPSLTGPLSPSRDFETGIKAPCHSSWGLTAQYPCRTQFKGNNAGAQCPTTWILWRSPSYLRSLNWCPLFQERARRERGPKLIVECIMSRQSVFFLRSPSATHNRWKIRICKLRSNERSLVFKMSEMWLVCSLWERGIILFRVWGLCLKQIKQILLFMECKQNLKVLFLLNSIQFFLNISFLIINDFINLLFSSFCIYF